MAAWIGTLASSAIASWRGYRPALVLGYALMGGGLAFLNADTHMLALAATATFGFGYGLLTAGTNLLVAELGGMRSASLVSLLNFMWGVGAMTCPLLIAFALKHNRISLTLLGCAAFGVVMVIGLLFTSFGADERPHEANIAEAAGAGPALHVTLALASLFFIYVAMENGIGIWAAEFSRRLANGITGLTTLAPTFFYGARRCAPGIAPPEGKNSRTWRIGLGGRRRCSPHRVSGRICGHRCGLFCRTWLCQHLPHLHSVALAMVRRARQENRGRSLRFGFARRICRTVAGRICFTTDWQLANWIVGPVALCADHDWPGADVAAADHRLRYS